MIVLPGPGLLVIIGGLALLATEYAWARAALDKARTQAERAKDLAMGKGKNRGRTTYLLVGGVAMLVVAGAIAYWWFKIR